MLSYQAVDLLEFALQQSNGANGGVEGMPVARVLRMLKNDDKVQLTEPASRSRLSRLMTYVRFQTPDKTLKLVKQLAKG